MLKVHSCAVFCVIFGSLRIAVAVFNVVSTGFYIYVAMFQEMNAQQCMFHRSNKEHTYIGLNACSVSLLTCLLSIAYEQGQSSFKPVCLLNI